MAKYAKRAFGYSYFPIYSYKGLPSALELTETALRDPMFYQIYQSIFYYAYRYLSYESHYKYEDLLLPGVKVQGVEVDRLTTYYDYFYSDITNALYVNKQEFEADNIHVQVRQLRLNHKPYSYKIHVQSAQVQDVLVSIYLGPKYDVLSKEMDMYEYFYNFVQLDSFDYKLVAGQNTIERSSKQSEMYVHDKMSYKDMYTRIMTAMKQQGSFEYPSDKFFGLPNRFMLPKGSPTGESYQLYVFISPVHSKLKMPCMYPFNKFAEHNAYAVPNAYLKDVMIYFKEFSEMNRTY